MAASKVPGYSIMETVIVEFELTENDVDLSASHDTCDLYIRYSQAIWDYLEEYYEFFENATTFRATDNQVWIDLPFVGSLKKYQFLFGCSPRA